MTSAEQRALEDMKEAARALERLIGAPFVDGEERQGEAVLLARAQLRLTACTWAKVERAAKRAAKVYETSAHAGGRQVQKEDREGDHGASHARRERDGHRCGDDEVAR